MVAKFWCERSTFSVALRLKPSIKSLNALQNANVIGDQTKLFMTTMFLKGYGEYQWDSIRPESLWSVFYSSVVSFMYWHPNLYDINPMKLFIFNLENGFALTHRHLTMPIPERLASEQLRDTCEFVLAPWEVNAFPSFTRERYHTPY